MSGSILIGLVNNAALLLALGLLYDTLSAKQRGARPNVLQTITGLILGLIGVAVMANPVKWEAGVIFDTRSVLLCVSGLFFGTLPTVMAVIITGGYRLSLGGDGAQMGVAVIACSGLIGIAWRHLRRREVQDFSLGELYLFGLAVHLVMILCMFLLPRQMVASTMLKVGVPVLLVYPVGTALLGKLMAGRHARKRAEDALRASEEKYRELVENANSMILKLDRSGKVQFINEYGQQFFGFTEQELLGQPIVGTIVPPRETGGRDLVELIDGVFRDPDQHKQVFNENVCRDGRRVWVSWSNKPILDDAGQVVGMFCVGTDITERKRAVDLLHENQEKYQQLFELSSDAIALIDNQTGRLLEVNSAATGLYGYTRQELLSLTNGDLSAEPEETQRVTQTPAKPGQLVTIPLRHHRKKDGTVFPVEITGRFFTWEGRPVHIAAIRDITTRQQAEQERLQLERQTQETQKLESLGVLAGGIAHDFNNLLMTILGNADLALNELSPLSPARVNLEEIDKASRRAADLCRQLLAYSGRGRFVVEAISMSEVIQELVQLLGASISKKARLSLNLSSHLAPVRGDATQLRQVVMNLVINASEAIGERDGVIAISTGMTESTADDLRAASPAEALAPGPYVWIEVSDTGCGMDAETQRRIFEPFFSTKFTGRGLGLSAVLGIVRGHKGAISMRSVPGEGTTFRVLLPAAAPLTAPAKPAEAPAATWRGAGTVLLVDDEPAVLQTGRRQLERLGCQVLTAADGEQAIAVYREHRTQISLVMLDLTMPRLNGEETLRALRAIDPAARIVLCSGYTETDIQARFGSLGLAGFLQKPFTLKELQLCLEAAFASPARRA